jgi:hypothetical protein
MTRPGGSAWTTVALIGGLLGVVILAALAIGSVNVPLRPDARHLTASSAPC